MHGWLESDNDGDEGRDWRSRFIFLPGAPLESTGSHEHPRVVHDLKVPQVRLMLCHAERAREHSCQAQHPSCVAGGVALVVFFLYCHLCTKNKKLAGLTKNPPPRPLGHDVNPRSGSGAPGPGISCCFACCVLICARWHALRCGAPCPPIEVQWLLCPRSTRRGYRAAARYSLHEDRQVCPVVDQTTSRLWVKNNQG
jgi:hypothetical protein